MSKKEIFFEFVSYAFEPAKRRIVFNYQQHGISPNPVPFQEIIVLPKAVDIKKVPKDLLNNILRDLHFVLGISYYKFQASHIVRHSYNISKKEADFWNVIYKNGLGEFYYRNKLNPQKAPKFSYNKKTVRQSYSLERTGKYLVALSGGKDSIVAAELLKEQGIEVTALFTETNRKIDLVNKIADVMGVKLVKVNRYLDYKVFERHKYDGHIPISAIYGFLGILYSVLYGYDYFVVANEYSANFGNIKYKGLNVNHQWSKCSEFENLFSRYVSELISPDVGYFSLVKPFYEIRIAQEFSKYKKYFPYFSGCNKNFTLKEEANRSLWCGECPKCVFAFILLSAFLSRKEIINIFGQDVFDNPNNVELCEDILGLGKMKPFDCVGTFEESRVAFIMGSSKFRDSLIVKLLISKVRLNKEEMAELFKTQSAPNIPTAVKFIGMKNVLILGHGKEGVVSKQYIRKYYPKLKIGIADQSISKDYAKKQKNFDVAIKSPGINKSIVNIPYTTATNIFFSTIKEKGNFSIGVTGSKGKSTTSSLIYSILREAKKDVVLVGNIGKPMLAALLRPIPQDRIFVVELSSYQLDDIQFSPNVAVVTNLFPEHLDYHGDVKKYYQAKQNITRFQNENDIVVSDSQNKELKNLLKATKSKPVKLSKEKFSSNLLGVHNQNNIALAVTVARQLGVEDKNIQEAIRKFKPLPHRLESVGKYHGVEFYDDAISTTPESTILAIKALKRVDTIFLGGQDRGYDFKELEKVIKQYKISNVVLFPDSGSKIKLSGVKIFKTKNMKEAVKFAYENTRKGRICLLSCASPSYSLWKDFEEKGSQFKRFVKQLA